MSQGALSRSGNGAVSSYVPFNDVTQILILISVSERSAMPCTDSAEVVAGQDVLAVPLEPAKPSSAWYSQCL